MHKSGDQSVKTSQPVAYRVVLCHFRYPCQEPPMHKKMNDMKSHQLSRVLQTQSFYSNVLLILITTNRIVSNKSNSLPMQTLHSRFSKIA